MSPTAPRLQLSNLHRLHIGPITLEVTAGECISIMGPSGSGKSVLLRSIADLDPHEGEALVDGKTCSAMPAPEWRRQVTYVPAESGWWDEYVAPHFPRNYDFGHWLPQLALNPDAAQWPVTQLSTGERQRLALLRAIHPGCKVLLLDEPTSGLDPDAIERVETLLKTLQKDKGLSIVIVTHAQEQAERMAHRQFQLRDGQLHLHNEEATA